MDIQRVSRKSSQHYMVWMDLEMTGLDPEKEHIIEIATIVTDSDLVIVGEGPNIVIHQKPVILKKMDEWNQRQHTKSGLLELVTKSKITTESAEEETLVFLRQYCIAKKSPLCGSSIHHDRRFLIKYMPKLNDFLHYRHIDVSTIKGLVERWYTKSKSWPKRRDAHRAIFDLRESIEDLRFMRDTYFK